MLIMNKVLLFAFCIIRFSLHALSVPHLVIKPLKGTDYISSLANVGKLVYAGDSLYLYDKSKSLLFSDLLSNVSSLSYTENADENTTNVGNVKLLDDELTIRYTRSTCSFDVFCKVKAIARLYSTDGNLLQTVSIENGTTQLDMTKYPKGVYILLCNRQCLKVIKQ